MSRNLQTGRNAQVKRKHPCDALAGSSSSASATAATGRKVQVKGKRPVENPSSASTIAASGRKAQVKGKHPSVESSSSASTITDMVVEEKDYVTRRLESIRSILSEGTDVIDTEEAPQSPYYVDESGYPPEAAVSTYFKKVMEQGLSLEFFREYNLKIWDELHPNNPLCTLTPSFFSCVGPPHPSCLLPLSYHHYVATGSSSRDEPALPHQVRGVECSTCILGICCGCCDRIELNVALRPCVTGLW
ncbi:hypothetical protein DM860_013554 [Cuscuta australis]|uniref:Uncharacterized protein n=1 Tax=Cuscuta australis TaxID=267555 RepID=A0A328EDV4_9ASTE|nr:hypothetical protein DM860_013554 [Cuscuta australis]